jgi:serine/threonine protein kinase
VRVCERFEHAWREGQRPLIEDFLGEAAEQDRAYLLAALLRWEWTFRRQGGEPFHCDEYTARLSRWRGTVEEAWNSWLETALTSDALPPTRLPVSGTLCSVSLPGQTLPQPVALAGYERVEKLAEGGMGVVYRAFDPYLKRPVALKMIRADIVVPDRLGRFRKEAEALARLQHPHIVQVYGWQEQAGQPILVLEYIAGGSLEERLKLGRLGVLESVRLVAVLARAVQAAHQAGVVHRDLKPANVLMAPPVEGNSGTVAGGFPKVSDFGLAYLASPDALAFEVTSPGVESLVVGDQTRVTATGDVVGTPAYMAPEQAGGELRQVGPTTDVWALGVILYRCLSGRLPFPGSSIAETLDWVKTRPPEPLRAFAPQVPEGLVSLCLRCLHKGPMRRPASGELALALEQFAATEATLGPEQLAARPADEPFAPVLPNWQELSLQNEESVSRPAQRTTEQEIDSSCTLPQPQRDQTEDQPLEKPDKEVQTQDLEEWAAALLLVPSQPTPIDRLQREGPPRKRRKKKGKGNEASWSSYLVGRSVLVIAAAGLLIGLAVVLVIATRWIARILHGH